MRWANSCPQMDRHIKRQGPRASPEPEAKHLPRRDKWPGPRDSIELAPNICPRTDGVADLYVR